MSFLRVKDTEILKIFLNDFFFFSCQFYIFFSLIVTRKNFFEIGIPCEIRFSISESKQCIRCIWSYSGEFFELLFLSRKCTTKGFTDELCGFEDIASSRIVAESLIVREKCFVIGLRKGFDIWKCS